MHSQRGRWEREKINFMNKVFAMLLNGEAKAFGSIHGAGVFTPEINEAKAVGSNSWSRSVYSRCQN